jgi:D-arabinose 1-dehydrogenase-like Zn-dependent alcohol dehydrogenase
LSNIKLKTILSKIGFIMQALFLEKIGKLSLQDIPVPVPADDEILLRVTHCGICRSDAKMFHSGHHALVLPRILGHEICVCNEHNDERFVIWPGDSCGECEPCRNGSENLCKKMQIMGFDHDGGFAEYIAVKKQNLISVPESLPGAIACMSEPLACTINALEQGKISTGEHLLILGGGTLGVMLAIAAEAAGARPMIIETNPEKLLKLKTIIDGTAIESAPTIPVAKFDYVINAAASIDTLTTGLSVLKPSGTFVFFSSFSAGELSASTLNTIHYRQLRVIGAYGCTRAQMQTAISLLNHSQTIFGKIIDKTINLNEASTAFPTVINGTGYRIVVKI